MKVAVPGGEFSVHVERPAVEPAPVVVVVQEIFGVNEDLRETCRELAAQGFIAVAPDLFWREEPGLDLNSWSEDEWKKGLELYGRFDRDKGVSDLEATIDAARNLAGSTGRVGIMGFCLGGLMTFLAAARTSVDAAVEYYGASTEDYLGEVSDIEAPLMIHLAEEDEFMPRAAQERIALAVSGRANIQLFSYPGCSHAFARHSGAHYDPSAAELANGRTIEFLRASLR